MSAPVTRPGGLLLLLAVWRWKRPEARLLLGLSCIPQTPVAYEAVPLFLLVTTIGEGVWLWLSTLLLIPVINSLAGKPYDEWMMLSGQWMIWVVYLPALVIVLRKPNVAPENDLLVNLIGRVAQREAGEKSSDGPADQEARLPIEHKPIRLRLAKVFKRRRDVEAGRVT